MKKRQGGGTFESEVVGISQLRTIMTTGWLWECEDEHLSRDSIHRRGEVKDPRGLGHWENNLCEHCDHQS